MIELSWDPLVWGTVGQWASAIGTFSAFMAAFYVIRRDARVRRRQQAAKVAVHLVTTERDPADVKGKHRYWYDLTAKNLSDEPIYDVAFFLVRGSKGKRKEVVDILSSTPILLPGDELSERRQYEYGIDVFFRDNAGARWRRNIRGKLMAESALQFWLRSRFYSEPPVRFMIQTTWSKLQRRRRRER